MGAPLIWDGRVTTPLMESSLPGELWGIMLHAIDGWIQRRAIISTEWNDKQM